MPPTPCTSRSYREAFEEVAELERGRRRAANRDDHDEALPGFGRSDTPYPEVQAFYGYWMAYCAGGTFAWCDEHYVPDAPNRRVRRAMEKENEKEREIGRREWSDQVRAVA